MAVLSQELLLMGRLDCSQFWVRIKQGSPLLLRMTCSVQPYKCNQRAGLHSGAGQEFVASDFLGMRSPTFCWADRTCETIRKWIWKKKKKKEFFSTTRWRESKNRTKSINRNSKLLLQPSAAWSSPEGGCKTAWGTLVPLLACGYGELAFLLSDQSVRALSRQDFTP